jgi:hypothetical protein
MEVALNYAMRPSGSGVVLSKFVRAASPVQSPSVKCSFKTIEKVVN